MFDKLPLFKKKMITHKWALKLNSNCFKFYYICLEFRSPVRRQIDYAYKHNVEIHAMASKDDDCQVHDKFL